MILLKPEVQVLKKKFNGIERYFLHAVTNFPNSGFENDGFESIPKSVSSDGILQVTLRVREAVSPIPTLNYITPIVHIVPLGSILLREDDIVEVGVMINSGNGRNSGEKLEKRGIVRDIDIKEKTRPFELI